MDTNNARKNQGQPPDNRPKAKESRAKLPIDHIIRKRDKIPFDVNQARANPIDTTDIYTLVPQLETFRSQLATFVRQALADSGSASNPLTVFCPGFKVSFPS